MKLAEAFRRYPHLFVSLLVAAVALGVYIHGLPPSITWQNDGADGAELAAAVKNLGVPHPPGYPTYVLVGKAFSFLPAGDLAHRLAIMSAVFATAAVVLTYFTMVHLFALLGGQKPLPTTPPSYVSAGVASLGLAFATVLWSQAIMPEVYGLNAFFVAALLFLLVQWMQTSGGQPKGAKRSNWQAIVAAYLLGFGLGNHLTVVFVGLPVLAVFVAGLWRRAGTVALMFGGLLTGLAVYAYLPLRAASSPPINWGDAHTWSGFRWMITGGPYQDYVFSVPEKFLPGRIGAWANLFLRQFNGLGLAVGIVGMWSLWQRRLLLTLALLLPVVALSVYAIGYNTGDSFVSLVPAVACFAVFLGAGLYYFLSELMLPRFIGQGLSVQRIGLLMALVALALVVLVPGFGFFRGKGDMDLSHDTAAIDFAKRTFGQTEDGAIVLADSDKSVFALWYMSFVVQPESARVVVARNLLQFKWYRDELRQRYPGVMPEADSQVFSKALQALVQNNAGKRPVYTTYQDSVLQQGYYWQERDGLYKLLGAMPTR